jgi:prepilin signal peptidase PulO-like enzyme (type II secretory pathway)
VLQILDLWFFRFVTESSAWQHAVVLFPLGLFVGQRIWWWAERMDQDLPFGHAPQCRQCHAGLSLRARWSLRCPACGFRISIGRTGTALLTSLLFVLVAGSLMHWRGQSLVEGGSIDYFHVRLVVQLVFVSLLVTATVIDLQHYIIPDEITLPGTLFGVAVSIAFGNLQFVPVWVDFNDPMTSVYGPYIPEWIKQNHHIHGRKPSALAMSR